MITAIVCTSCNKRQGGELYISTRFPTLRICQYCIRALHLALYSLMGREWLVAMQNQLRPNIVYNLAPDLCWAINTTTSTLLPNIWSESKWTS